MFELLYSEIAELAKEGYIYFVFSHGGLFADAARMAVISLKAWYPKIRTAYAKTNDEDEIALQKKYNEVWTNLVDSYSIIDNSDYCLFYDLKGDNRELEYAENTNKPYDNLACL